jgi:nitrous oxidase accessory protein
MARPVKGALALACGLVGLVPGATAAGPQPGATRGAPAVERPRDGVVVRAGADLQAALDAAPPGAVLALEPGSYAGPLVVRSRLTIWGPRDAVVRSNGQGTTIDVRADGAELAGFTVDGSGQRFDKTDAAVHVSAVGARVRELSITHALFGIVAEQSRALEIAGNEIVGDAAAPLGLRGDGIRLWETRDSVVEGNVLHHCRDMVIWYSPGNRVTQNAVDGSRYAIHFMYSSDVAIEDNRYVDNIVGVFVMYSHDVALRRNVLAGNLAPDAMGVGAKESGNLVIEGNQIVGDRLGLYLDNSPYRVADVDTIRGNTFALCQVGVTFQSSETRSAFLDSAFRNNQAQVSVEGGGDALGVTWQGNYFDDYEG